jgi:hypothetical protein
VDPVTGELKNPTTGEAAEVENVFSDDITDTGNSDTNVNN